MLARMASARPGSATLPPAQHQVATARLLTAAPGVLHRPDFAIRNQTHLRADGRPNVRNQLPIRGRAVAIAFGAGMHDQLCRAVFRHGLAHPRINPVS